MTEVLVSIRLPSEMARELRKLAERRRYLDVSEALRDIIRQRWHRDEQPLLYELDRMRVELKQEMRILKQEVEGSRWAGPAAPVESQHPLAALPHDIRAVSQECSISSTARPVSPVALCATPPATLLPLWPRCCSSPLLAQRTVSTSAFPRSGPSRASRSALRS